MPVVSYSIFVIFDDFATRIPRTGLKIHLKQLKYNRVWQPHMPSG
jgi:hypothetical protein